MHHGATWAVLFDQQEVSCVLTIVNLLVEWSFLFRKGKPTVMNSSLVIFCVVETLRSSALPINVCQLRILYTADHPS